MNNQNEVQDQFIYIPWHCIKYQAHNVENRMQLKWCLFWLQKKLLVLDFCSRVFEECKVECTVSSTSHDIRKT